METVRNDLIQLRPPHLLHRPRIQTNERALPPRQIKDDGQQNAIILLDRIGRSDEDGFARNFGSLTGPELRFLGFDVDLGYGVDPETGFSTGGRGVNTVGEAIGTVMVRCTDDGELDGVGKRVDDLGFAARGGRREAIAGESRRREVGDGFDRSELVDPEASYYAVVGVGR